MGTIFIPDKIAVGFQERSDTYTKRLAYVVYYDAKGHRRKEKSWESWCDAKIEKKDFDNVPTSGFVLNKKVGGYKSDWNFRQAYVRVYDPRDFEFEITVPNLVFILENVSSIKGKGLEGEFVYAWDGADLLLLPVDSPDYQSITGYSDMLKDPVKIPPKSLVLGGTYMTKSNQKWIYLGRFEKYSIDWDEKKKGRPLGPHYFFAVGSGFEAIKSISGKFIQVVSEEPVKHYAELMDELEHRRIYSPAVPDKFEYVPVKIPEFLNGSYFPQYDYNLSKKGLLGLSLLYEGHMVDGIAIRRVHRGLINPNADGYYIDHNWMWRQDPIYELMYTQHPELFDRQKGIELDVLNTMEFFEKYQYLANGKLYHG